MKYVYGIKLGDLSICFESDYELYADIGMQNYLIESSDLMLWDILIYVSELRSVPQSMGQYLGSDLLLDYYSDDEWSWAVARPGTSGSNTYVKYKRDFSYSEVMLNETSFPGVIRSLDKILQLFPVRQLLIHYHSWILHSSQVNYHGQGIIFTAPSGTGKTTQARLWNTHEDTEIVCNDRTLLCDRNGFVLTYGYPVDGSEPVHSTRVLSPAAIVVLGQGPENRIIRLKVLKALKLLMDQTVNDCWDMEERMLLQREWMELMDKIPVYQLICTPDQRAVKCLKNQLIKDGIIDGYN